MKRFKFITVAGAVACLMQQATTASADVIVGTRDAGNCYPFMCNDSGVSSGQSIEYQQIYSSSAFGATTTFDGLTFDYDALSGGSATVLNGNYDITFYYSSKSVNGLGTTPSSNEGTLIGSFFNSTLGGTDNPSFTINGSSLTYDPGLGNLLVDIIVTNQANVPNGTGNGYNQADDTGSTTSRAWRLGGSPSLNPDSIGLVTTFDTVTVAAVPEPSSWLLLVVALLGFGAFNYRRNRIKSV